MATCLGDADAPLEQEALLALYRDKSASTRKCPTPRLDRAMVVHSTGELLPIACGRNTCPYCRRRNVQVTAAMIGLNATRMDEPPTIAALSTTRDWIDEATLREGWHQFARAVRKEVDSLTKYHWFREWTEGKNDGIRRTHYHSIWTRLDVEQGQALAEISRDVWGRVAGAYSERAHGATRVWDAGGLARYVAGLVGHHLKANQAPPPGWFGRRNGGSRGWYAGDPKELRKEAAAAVRDERLAHALTVELFGVTSPDSLPSEIVDELLTARLAEVRAEPMPRIVRINPRTFCWPT